MESGSLKKGFTMKSNLKCDNTRLYKSNVLQSMIHHNIRRYNADQPTTADDYYLY